MTRFSPEEARAISKELVAKAWASARWSKGSRPEHHVCHRAACLIGQMEDEIAELRAAQSERNEA